MANLVEYECKYCHKITLDFPSQKRNYCSKDCFFAAKRTGMIKIKSSKIKHICEYCHKEFLAYPSRPGRFCSNQCRSNFAARQLKPNRKRKYPNIIKYCRICGKESIKKGSEMLRPGYGSYCSLDCRNKGNSISKRGSGNPNWLGGIIPNIRGKNWSSQSKKSKKRDNHECQVCHRKRDEDGRKWIIDVHHIIPYRHFNGDFERANELSNLITVCRKCHRKLEKAVNNSSIINISLSS